MSRLFLSAADRRCALTKLANKSLGPAYHILCVRVSDHSIRLLARCGPLAFRSSAMNESLPMPAIDYILPAKSWFHVFWFEKTYKGSCIATVS